MPALISTDDLQDRSGDRGHALLEVAHGAPPAQHAPAVVPGARRVDWQWLLWDERERRLASPSQLAARLGQLGVGPGTALTVYGDPVQFGAYAVWALEVAGYPDVALLDGGKEGWVADGRPLAQVRAATPDDHDGSQGDATAWFGQPETPERIDRVGVAGALGDPGWAFLDARSAEEFSGARVSPPEFAVDHGAAVGGHLPGARHLPHRALLGAGGRFRSPAELAEQLVAAGVEPDRQIVTYCRLGHRAAMAWFALRHVLGAPHVRVYEGSWTEWGSLVGAPVER